MARSRGYWKRKDSRRQRRILNRSLDIITQVGTAKLAVLMAGNMSGSSLIGNRRELTLIDQITQRELAKLDEVSDYDYECEYEDYLDELEADMADQRYDDLWDSRYDELDSHYDWNY